MKIHLINMHIHVIHQYADPKVSAAFSCSVLRDSGAGAAHQMSTMLLIY